MIEDDEPPAPPSEPEGKPRSLTWEYDIPLLNNLFMARDLLLVLVLSLIIMQLLVLLVGFLAGEGAVILPLQVYGIVAGVMMVLYLIAAVVVFWNKHRTEFTVGPRGVAYVSGARERRRNRIILALSFLLGRPGPALIATSQEAGHFDWGELEKVTVHRRQRVITLSNSWRPVLRLYCTPENFDEVVALVQEYAGRAAARPKEVRPRRKWWFYAAWVVGVAVATFLGMAGYDTNLDDMWRWLLLSAALVLIAGLVEAPLGRRLFAFAGFLVGIFVFIYLLRDAFRPIRGPSGFYYGRPYEIDTWVFVLSLIGQLALLGMAGWRLFGKSLRSKAKRSGPPDR
ncbi:MAG: hypothetical protein JW990_20040 [Thermoleophilia bacterium]|nr:hypothetical protein [Thermoleophilia bacterium]